MNHEDCNCLDCWWANDQKEICASCGCVDCNQLATDNKTNTLVSAEALTPLLLAQPSDENFS